MKSLPELRRDAVAIFHAGVEAVDARGAVLRHLRMDGGRLHAAGESYDLSALRGIHVVGAGKASAKMAQAVEDLLGDRLVGGVVAVKYGHAVPLAKVDVREAGHPFPDDAGTRAAGEIVRLLERTGSGDLVLCLLSGGGSALLVSPAEGLTLEDKKRTTELLLNCGATIREINAVRKHLSRVKGGRLARLAYPARLLALILSDVVGDDVGTIASGPTVPDESSFGDCLTVLNRYRLMERIPDPVMRHLKEGAAGWREETPKPGDPVFAESRYSIIGSNLIALRAAGRKAEALGYHVEFLSGVEEGEAREVARIHAAAVKEAFSGRRPVSRPTCLLSGGETTVTVRGGGKGGRNQEFALAAALEIDGLPQAVILSAGTDGTDGPTEAAGACADGETARRAKDLGLDAEAALADNDSYHFFRRLGDLVVTGPTLTNVMDLRVALAG